VHSTDRAITWFVIGLLALTVHGAIKSSGTCAFGCFYGSMVVMGRFFARHSNTITATVLLQGVLEGFYFDMAGHTYYGLRLFQVHRDFRNPCHLLQCLFHMASTAITGHSENFIGMCHNLFFHNILFKENIFTPLIYKQLGNLSLLSEKLSP